MAEPLLLKLKELIEGKILFDEWEVWWKEHQAALEPLLNRHTYLLLKKRPLLAAEQLLTEHEISFKQKLFPCSRCGAARFCAIPGKTTQHDIVEFASQSNISSRERIIKERWMHPGLYCPNGCPPELWNIKAVSDAYPDSMRLPRSNDTETSFMSFAELKAFLNTDDIHEYILIAMGDKKSLPAVLHPSSNSMLIIEDEDEAAAAVKTMMAFGIPVVTIDDL